MEFGYKQIILRVLISGCSAARLARFVRDEEVESSNLSTPTMYTTYILVSLTRGKYYTGHTEDLEKRLYEHNSGQTKSIRYGIPWQVIWIEEFPTRAEAMKKEIQIKKRGVA